MAQKQILPRSFCMIKEATGQLLGLAEIGGALNFKWGSQTSTPVGRGGGYKEDWAISVASLSSLSVSFCTGAFSV